MIIQRLFVALAVPGRGHRLVSHANPQAHTYAIPTPTSCINTNIGPARECVTLQFAVCWICKRIDTSDLVLWGGSEDFLSWQQALPVYC